MFETATDTAGMACTLNSPLPLTLCAVPVMNANGTLWRCSRVTSWRSQSSFCPSWAILVQRSAVVEHGLGLGTVSVGGCVGTVGAGGLYGALPVLHIVGSTADWLPVEVPHVFVTV